MHRTYITIVSTNNCQEAGLLRDTLCRAGLHPAELSSFSAATITGNSTFSVDVLEEEASLAQEVLKSHYLADELKVLS